MTAAGMPRTPSKDATAHRELIVTDPPMLGADVKALKAALRERLKARGLDDDVRIGQHDKFTYATWLACVEVGYALGLNSDTYLKKDEGRGVCTVGAQRIYRDPDTRTDEQRFNAKARADRVKEGPRYYEKLAKEIVGAPGKGPDAALAFAKANIGKTENPAGSNWGHPVQDWITLAGYGSPVPWCFAPGTLVNTPTGLRRIETITAGDTVMDAHAGVAVVGAAHVRDAADRFRLTAHGIDGTTVSGEHPYIARRCLTRAGRPREFGPPEWIAVRDLARGDLIAQPVLGGAVPMDEARAYIVGRYLADGWGVRRPVRYGRTARVERFICDSHDKRDEIAAALDIAGLGYSERIYPTVIQFALRVDASALLAECGVNAVTKRLPPGALMWHEGARAALMEGYLAGDGTTDRSITRANSISRELMLGMAQIARSLGHIVSVRAQSREPEATIAGRVVNQATERYEMTFRPDGIQEGHRQYLAGIDEHVWVPVRGVEEAPPGPVHNLTVSGESTFIADGYAVHNCGCFTNAGVVAAGVPNGKGWIGYTPAIVAHARAGTGGWSWHAEGKPGDLALFDSGPGGDIAVHVGLVEKALGGGQYQTIEGNTSSGSSGSQANGGGVFRRQRSTAGGFHIIGFARPPYGGA